MNCRRRSQHGWAAGRWTATTPARIAQRGEQAQAGQGPKNRAGKKRKRKPAAAAALARVTEAGHRQAAPGHPWLDPVVIVDSSHRRARVALAVDRTQRKLAKAGAKTKVHLVGALVGVTSVRSSARTGSPRPRKRMRSSISFRCWNRCR